MGLLDLPTPVLGFIDGLIDFLPAWIRLTFWALASSALTMWMYKKFSKQEDLGALKAEIKKTQEELAFYDGEISGLWPLIGKSMKLSFRNMGMTLVPALWASIPVLFVMVFIYKTFGYYFPEADTEVQLKPYEVSLDTELEVDSRGSFANSRGFIVRWPAEGQSVAITDQNGADVLSVPLDVPMPVIHKKQWWNWLLGNPAGYLDDNAPVEGVEVDLPWMEFIPGGPSWVRGWEFLYFMVLIAGSIFIKVAFRIH